MSVDLPAPFSPTTAWISPGSTLRLTSRLATIPGKRLTMWRSSTTGVTSSSQPLGVVAQGLVAHGWWLMAW